MSVIGFAEGQFLATPEVDLRMLVGPHPYEAENSSAIEANWRDEQARNPAVFDGRIALFARIALADGRLVGTCHEARFASFLHWRLSRRTDVAAHLFAMAIPVTSDGAVLTVRMAPWTINAGQVYFAGGSLEPSDFVDGVADIAGNMRREVLEETGIDLAGTAPERVYRVIRTERGVVVVRRHLVARSAAEVAAGVRTFVSGEERPEIVEPVLVHRGDAPDPGLLPWVRNLLDWHFATPIDI